MFVARAGEQFDAEGRLTHEATQKAPREVPRRGRELGATVPAGSTPVPLDAEHSAAGLGGRAHEPAPSRLRSPWPPWSRLRLPAFAETRIEKNLKLSPGGEFRLDTDMGKVTVTGSPDSGGHVVITSKPQGPGRAPDLPVRRDPRGRSITRPPERHRSLVPELRQRGPVRDPVPDETRLSIETSGGGITISGHPRRGEAGHLGRGHQRRRTRRRLLDADTSGGGIVCSNIRAE